MKRDELELIRGSGNVYRDLGKENADIEQFKGLLAAEITKTLNREGLSVRKAPPHRHCCGGLLAHSER